MLLAIIEDGLYHGYAVIEVLRQRTDGAIDLPEGTIYPALHRLERAGRDIATAVDFHYNQVGSWRSRYAEFGLAGLEDDERPGRPCVYDHDDVLLLVKTVTEPPPDGATRWTMEALAAAMNANGIAISASQVWRICRALDLKPWQVQSWMTSHAPDFWERPAMCAASI